MKNDMEEQRAQVGPLVPLQFPFLVANESPLGKCDDWNEQFVKKAVSLGLDGLIIGEKHLGRLDTKGNSIAHHAIAVGYSPSHKLWCAADLSAGQIAGHDEPFYQQAATLTELAVAVRSGIGGEWKAFNDETRLRQEMRRQTELYRARMAVQSPRP